MPKTNRKIAFLLRSTHLSGAERRFVAIAAALNARGQSAVVVLEKSDLAALEKANGGTLPNSLAFHMPGWAKMLTRGRKRLPRLHRLSGAQWLYRIVRKVVLARLQREQNIGFWHVALDTDMSHSVLGPALFEVTSPDWADRITDDVRSIPQGMPLVAVSETVHERLKISKQPRRVFLAPLPFANRNPVSAPRPDMAAKENRIVFAHRLIPRKNGLLFARVAQRFLQDHSDWTIAIHGVGPQFEAIQNVLKQEIGAGRAEVRYVNELPAELSRSRLFVSIIQPDNYPSQSVLEALFCGNALLLSEQGHSREKFMDGNGAMTEISEEGVLEALTKLVSNGVALEAMGARSRQLAEARFSQDAYIAHLGRMYAQVGFRDLVERLDEAPGTDHRAEAHLKYGA